MNVVNFLTPHDSRNLTTVKFLESALPKSGRAMALSALQDSQKTKTKKTKISSRMGEFISPEAIQLFPKFAIANLMRSRIKLIEQNKTMCVIGDDT